MTRALLLLLVVAVGCGASVLNVMSDSIDAGRLGLKAKCTAETVSCEVARMRFNDWTVAYDAALAAQGTPQADALEQAAADAMVAFLATLQRLHSELPTSGGDDVDGGTR